MVPLKILVLNGKEINEFHQTGFSPLQIINYKLLTLFGGILIRLTQAKILFNRAQPLSLLTSLFLSRKP